MDDNREDTCQYRKCGKTSTIVYLGRGLCEKHWTLIAEMETDKAHKLLKIKLQKEEKDEEQLAQDSDNKKEAVCPS